MINFKIFCKNCCQIKLCGKLLSKIHMTFAKYSTKNHDVWKLNFERTLLHVQLLIQLLLEYKVEDEEDDGRKREEKL